MQEVEYDVGGGVKLYGQEWLVKGERPAKAFVLFNHGLSDHISRSDYMFEEFVRNGYSVIAYDQRGQGKSAKTFWQKGLTNGKLAYNDLDRIIERILEVYKPQKLFMMGHSNGGGLTINYACDGKLRHKLAGFICIAPWVGKLHETSREPAWRLWGIKQLAKFVPWFKGFVPLDPYVLCEEPEFIKASLEDPYICKWATAGQIASALERAERIYDPKFNKGYDSDKPLLITTGKKDQVCDCKEAVRLYEALDAVKDRKIINDDDAWHEPFRALKGKREKFVAELIEWLDAHCETSVTKIESALTD